LQIKYGLTAYTSLKALFVVVIMFTLPPVINKRNVSYGIKDEIRD